MLKKLLAQVKEYKTASILTPICMIFEVIFEVAIPVLMGSIGGDAKTSIDVCEDRVRDAAFGNIHPAAAEDRGVRRAVGKNAKPAV